VSIRRKLNILASLAACLWLGGCGFSPPDAEFVNREDVYDLESDVRKAVQQELVNDFGTPHDMVAWLKLPLDYGGIPGVTAETDLEGEVQQFNVSFDEEAAQEFADAYKNDVGVYELPPGGLTLHWVTGAYAGQSMEVLGFDGEQNVVITREALKPAPPAGDQFMLSAGENLKHGRRLYMEHCMHCHGVSGDGNGPTAPYLNPLPRDYRLGVFKFKSTKPPEKITRDDLARTIKYGIPGTYMPSFLLLTEDELHDIIEYVRWLAMRGEVEEKAVTELKFDFSKNAIDAREESGEPEEEIEASIEEAVANMPELFDTTAGDLADNWKNAGEESSLIVPAIARVPDTPESRARGRKFFLEKCTNCHGHVGRGNGAMTTDYQKNEATGEFYPRPGLYNAWGDPVKPRNLTKGIYRGGRRPIDIYRRIYGGIEASKMPNFASTPPETIWDTVNYVLHIPFAEPDEFAEVDAEYERTKKPEDAEESTVEAQSGSDDRKQTSLTAGETGSDG
jgi:mono/diheme cytochrome c family protein